MPCRSTPNLSVVTEKSALYDERKLFEIPLAASPARPGTSNPARSRDAKKPLECRRRPLRAFRGSQKGGGGAFLLFAFLLEQRASLRFCSCGGTIMNDSTARAPFIYRVYIKWSKVSKMNNFLAKMSAKFFFFFLFGREFFFSFFLLHTI